MVEPSAGVDRTVLALLCNAYDEETVTDEKGKSETRIVMRFHPRMAPIKVREEPHLLRMYPSPQTLMSTPVLDPSTRP